MTSWRSLLGSTALGVTLTAGALIGPAAAAIDLGGYTGPVAMQYFDYETIINPTTGAVVPFTSVATGDELVGIIVISSIQNVSGTQTLWSQGVGTDGYLAGVFTGPLLNVTSSTTFVSNSSSTYQIYQLSSAPDPTQGIGGYAAAGGGCTLGQLCYNGITNVGGTLALNLVTVPGISSNPTVYTTGAYDFNATPPGGSYRFDLNVTGGTAQSQFDTNGVLTALGTYADFNVQGEFCTNSTVNCRGGITVGNWEFLSTDPVTGNVVPEPSSVGLLGTALLAMGFIGWRSRKRS